MPRGGRRVTAFGGYDGSAKPTLDGFGYELQYLSTGEVRLDQYQLEKMGEPGAFYARNVDASRLKVETREASELTAEEKAACTREALPRPNSMPATLIR